MCEMLLKTKPNIRLGSVERMFQIQSVDKRQYIFLIVTASISLFLKPTTQLNRNLIKTFLAVRSLVHINVLSSTPNNNNNNYYYHYYYKT